MQYALSPHMFQFDWFLLSRVLAHEARMSIVRQPKRIWRGGRVVEGARLERVYAGNRIEGSNPSLSAIDCA